MDWRFGRAGKPSLKCLSFIKLEPPRQGGLQFEDRELLRQLQEVEHLPGEDKTVVKKLLNAFLTKKHLQSFAR